MVLPQLVAQAATIADSRADFSGLQGQNGWYYGYRMPAGGADDYDAATEFLPFAGGSNEPLPWDGWSQTWTGTQWDLNTAGAAPWTYIASEGLHPNGINNVDEHWAIRRWTATELTADTWVRIDWHVRKQAAGGAGVTCAVHLNGARKQVAAIAGNATVGVTNSFWILAKPTDIFDLILSPVGPTGDTGDGSDGSYNWMVVTSSADSDSDGLPDVWEEIYFAGDLTKLSGAGDFDTDGLKDLAEFQRGSDPTDGDTDNDGLGDAVETATGVYVSPTDTGSSPVKPDTDGDGRTDQEEVNGTIKTDPNNPDTDGDTYSDGSEVASGHNPNDPNNNPDTTWIAHSRLEFSTDGSQGANSWYGGYRDYTGDGGGINYNADSAFIPFAIENWTGTMWDLAPSVAPWTELGPESTHPAGATPTHWTIRRWVAAELTKKTPLALRWHVRKSNVSCGNGVTGALYIDGQRVDSVTITNNNNTGITHTFYANVDVGQKVDLILSPQGTDNGWADGCDGSANWLVVDPTIPPNPVQPDGSVFIPVGAGDTDADGMPDVWEYIFFPGDLTKLTQTGDFDADGLKDPGEYTRDSDPTKPDTDSDGLGDAAETATGIYVSPTDTGSSPKNTDTDGDGLSDSEEVTRTPAPTNPNKTDTDGDGFSDPAEILDWGTDPVNAADNPLAQVIANSQAEFSGEQGLNGWFNGYRVYETGVSTNDYNVATDFVPFDISMWTGTQWDLDSGGAAPWTMAGPLDVHPNGTNNGTGGLSYDQEQWQIRRWVATEVTQPTPVAIIWHAKKSNLGGTGVTGSLHLNGKRVDYRVIPNNDGTGQVRRYYINLQPGETIDLALTPVGPTGDRGDGADGSQTWFWVDKRIPREPRQPDGTLFIPAGATQDSDGDGLMDFWELIYAADLTLLTGTGDNDSDGLKNTVEFARDSSPLLADTDGDGVSDAAESNTGTFVSPADTGSSPRKADTDGDGINDGAEVSRTPPTNPNKADTDGDGYTDPQEIAWPSDPTNPNDTPVSAILAHSQNEFSGVQGQNGWHNGYRVFNPVAGTINYNASQDFIPFPGGSDNQNPWDGTTQSWNNGAWDLNTAGAAPWTMQGALDVHPNGTNSAPDLVSAADPTKEHWVIRRWVGSELTGDTAVTVRWLVRKQTGSLANAGVTGMLFVNGTLVDSNSIAGNDGTGQERRYGTTLKQGDIVDLALSPLGPNGDRFDWSDGSQTWFLVDARALLSGEVRIATPTVSPAQGTVTLKWNSNAGASYTVWKSSDLKTWTQQVVPSGGAETTYTDTLGTPQPAARFYRVSQP
jgi:hypothetical protein